MDLAARAAGGDLLTRTTLRFGGGASPPAIDQAVRALQRVPGVLTVETDAGAASALVAHDIAVPITSLLAAAKLAGAEAKVVSGAGARLAATETAPKAKSLYQAHLRGVAVAAIVGVIIIDITFPNSPEKRWLYLVPLAAVWALVVLSSLVARRQ
jgi:hypothetical protein